MQLNIKIKGCKLKEFFVKHYQTKTLGEFLKQKFKRTDIDPSRGPLSLNYFFRQNKVTKEKIEFIKNKIGIDIMNNPEYESIRYNIEEKKRLN